MTTATTMLNGKTANEMRALLASGQVRSNAVIDYLRSKDKLRVPSQTLLDELTAGTAAKPAPKAAPAANGLLSKTGKPLHGAAKAKAQAKAAASSHVLSEAERLAEVATVASAMAGLIKRLAELAG